VLEEHRRLPQLVFHQIDTWRSMPDIVRSCRPNWKHILTLCDPQGPLPFTARFYATGQSPNPRHHPNDLRCNGTHQSPRFEPLAKPSSANLSPSNFRSAPLLDTSTRPSLCQSSCGGSQEVRKELTVCCPRVDGGVKMKDKLQALAHLYLYIQTIVISSFQIIARSDLGLQCG
jgi:hypothetical protein